MFDLSFFNLTYNLIVLTSALQSNQYPWCWFTTHVTTRNNTSQIAFAITHVIVEGILLASASL
jgi:hypothetical protein